MQQDNNQKTIIIATLSFILGFGLSWLISTNKAGDLSKTEIDTDDFTSEVKEVEVNSIKLKDQVEGVRVLLDEVLLKESGWAVIQEGDKGTPGRILGAQLFDKGVWTSGAVELLRGTVAGRTYYATLRKDNGDRVFDLKKDVPLTDEEGEPIFTKFVVTEIEENE